MKPEAGKHQAAVSIVLPSALPPALLASLAGAPPPASEEEVRALLVRLGHCPARAPAVTVELYGSLRLKTRCASLPLRAASIGEALAVLLRVCPRLESLLEPSEAADAHFRVSINGRTVTTERAHPLREGDRLILFSASVGG
jgi:hypothetical protein